MGAVAVFLFITSKHSTRLDSSSLSPVPLMQAGKKVNNRLCSCFTFTFRFSGEPVESVGWLYFFLARSLSVRAWQKSINFL